MVRARRVFGALLVVIVAAVVVLVVTVRPGLRDDADAVDAAWKPLVQPLDARYQTLTGLVTSLRGAGAGNRDATVKLARLLTRWNVVRGGTDIEDQVVTANQVEALAARARVLARTPRLSTNAPLQATITTFDKTRPSAITLKAYNTDVAKYQNRRDGVMSRIVARLDGYPMRPTLQLVA